jgi:hypothetical protein
VRGIVTAIAWLDISLRAFAPDQQREAAESLGLDASERQWAFRELGRLRADCVCVRRKSDTSLR